MDTTPTLSIITINLNNHDGLKRTIDSVVCQTFTDYEWIVIDGGSTDGSRKLIEQYADHFAYWCSEPDKGIYNAMNKGIAHAHGEWLQFLNSGDWLYEKTTLEKVFSKEYDADVLYGNGIMSDSNDLVIYPSKLSLSYVTKHNINHQASFYKAHLFKDNYYNEDYHVISDYLTILGFIVTGKVFEYINQLIVYIEAGGISSTQESSNEIAKTNNIIPPIIQRDLDKLEEIEEQKRFINSHKSLKIINNLNEKIINYLGTIIRKTEKKKAQRDASFNRSSVSGARDGNSADGLTGC